MNITYKIEPLDFRGALLLDATRRFVKGMENMAAKLVLSGINSHVTIKSEYLSHEIGSPSHTALTAARAVTRGYKNDEPSVCGDTHTARGLLYAIQSELARYKKNESLDVIPDSNVSVVLEDITAAHATLSVMENMIVDIEVKDD